jgi:CHAT domain-containing protein
MEHFYSHLALGEPEDRALWLAQRDPRSSIASDRRPGSDRGISIRDDAGSAGEDPDRPFSNPFYWSPFVLISSR